jgi:hypothetical protein
MSFARSLRAGAAAWRRGLAILALLTCAAAGAPAEPPMPAAAQPVRDVGAARIEVHAGGGTALLAAYASAALDAKMPGVTRAVVVVHGLNRDGDNYYAIAHDALTMAGSDDDATLIVAPQFLADEDIAPHALGPDVLHWGRNDWAGAEAAHGPVPASSFDALDAVLALLADRTRFPALANVVIAGHSAGAQLVQRYAVLGEGEAALRQAGIGVRYVVANPSSYLYLTADRPSSRGGFAPLAGKSCPGYNQWRYGLAGGVPVKLAASPAELERRYAGRDVIYLLGTADTNPRHPVLDKSCGAEAEGPSRYVRGMAYVRYIRSIGPPPQPVHRLREVAGVAHNGRRMLTSACGLASLFDRPGCVDE